MMTLKDICAKYLPGVTLNTASNYRYKTKGFPPRRGQSYDVKAVLEFYAKNTPNCSVINREARKALASMASDQEKNRPVIPSHVPPDDALDYENQLVNLRRAASVAFTRWQEADQESDPDHIASYLLKSYTTTMETLRRMEMDYLDFQKKQGEVLAIDDVRETVSRLISNTLQKLSQIPTLLAPQLKGMTSQARIKRILEDEIRKVVNGLQKCPF